MPLKPAFTLVIMGVSGCGKSTVGKAVADHTDTPFLDADDFHPQSNRDKMASGIALNDGDRKPWLETLRDEIKTHNDAGKNLILACSALKESYRDILRQAGPQVAFVYLHGSRELLLERLNSRSDHFFPPELLDSQLDTLEVPQDALVLEITAPPQSLAEQILVPFFNRLP